MIRILLLADTHLGLDLPLRPRVARRRRGEDFVANFERALEPALDGRIDLVVHGGDVFHRPRISREIAQRALRPLLAVARRGVPIFVVPGNHERSRLPREFTRLPDLHVFDRPRSFVTEVRGARVMLAGFPYVRRSVRLSFPDVVEETGWRTARADVALLCIHHCVEGATVGPGDYTFRNAPDVIRCRDIPAGFAAVLSGHIHRRQVLTRDLRGEPLRAPVLYPGSVERTSTAEIGEEKGYFIVEVEESEAGPGVRWRPEPLPARPMAAHALDLAGLAPIDVETRLRELIRGSPSDAVLRIRVAGEGAPGVYRVLSVANVRALAPRTMTVDLVYANPSSRRDTTVQRKPAAPRTAAPSNRHADEMLPPFL